MNLIGHIGAIMGLGTSVRGYAEALNKARMPLNVIDLDDGVPGRGRVAVDYPTRELQPINVVHLNLNHLQGSRLLDTPPLNKIVTPDRYHIAIVYWELSMLRPEWIETVNRFDEFWCASTFLAQTISQVFPGPVRVVRPALDCTPALRVNTRAHFGLPDDRFVFFYSLDAGSVLGRKNPRALVDAYVNEFAENEGACCLIKIHYGKAGDPEIDLIRSLAAQRRDIVFTDSVFPPEEMKDLFSLCDCYVSPHRSEGLGLTILEAMFAGKPVIATPYGGVTDFVNAQTAFPLEYKMTAVGPGNEPYPANYVWADPDIASIRACMRRVFQDRDMARSIGVESSRTVGAMYAADRIAVQIRSEIRRIGQIMRSDERFSDPA